MHANPQVISETRGAQSPLENLAAALPWSEILFLQIFPWIPYKPRFLCKWDLITAVSLSQCLSGTSRVFTLSLHHPLMCRCVIYLVLFLFVCLF